MTRSVEPPPPTYETVIATVGTQYHDPQAQRRELLDILRELDDRSLDVLVLSQSVGTGSISHEENETLLHDLAQQMAEAEPEFKQAGQQAARFYWEVDELFGRLKLALGDPIAFDDLDTMGETGTLRTSELEGLEVLRKDYRGLVFESSELSVKASAFIERFHQVIVPLCEDENVPSNLKMSKLNKLIEEANTFTPSNLSITERLNGMKKKFDGYVDTLEQIDLRHHYRQVGTNDEILRLGFKLDRLDEKLQNLYDSETMLTSAFRHLIDFVGESGSASREQLITMIVAILCDRGFSFAFACSYGAIQIKKSRIRERIQAAKTSAEETKQDRSRLGALIEKATHLLDDHSNTLKTAWTDALEDAVSLKEVLDDETAHEQIGILTKRFNSKFGAYNSMASYLRSYADTIHANHAG